MSLSGWFMRLMRLPSARQLAEVNERLRREAEAHEATLRELEAARSELESRVEERTRELSLVKARFETALHGANVYVFSQDRDLRYTWMSSPRGEAAEHMIGKTDAELKLSAEQDKVLEAKRQVLATGEPADCEVSYILPGQRGMFALHIDPTYAPDSQIDGIMCAAIDIGSIRSLQSEQRRLTEELGAALQRYETALRGSNVTVYTQDLKLRYTSVSNKMFGRAIEDIIPECRAVCRAIDWITASKFFERWVISRSSSRRCASPVLRLEMSTAAQVRPTVVPDTSRSGSIWKSYQLTVSPSATRNSPSRASPFSSTSRLSSMIGKRLATGRMSSSVCPMMSSICLLYTSPSPRD